MNKFYFFITIIGCFNGLCQQVPSKEENIPYLITFGKTGASNQGDDDCKQSFFFAIPLNTTKPFFIRIYDPGVGGAIDEIHGTFDTETTFSLFGGSNIYNSILGKNSNELSESRIGDLLFEETYGNEPEHDEKWISIGPINPLEGEYVKSLNSRVFKLLASGASGDDGNLYKYFLSSDKEKNIPISGSKAFTFEYTVRLNNNVNEVSHLYPFIDNEVTAIKQHNFDFDSNCKTTLFSVERIAEPVKNSSDGKWMTSEHKIQDKEREACLDFRISNGTKNNDVVMYMTNQYGEFLPFMSVPIGDIKFKKTILIE